MSTPSVKASSTQIAYKLLVELAERLSQDNRVRHSTTWIYLEDVCNQLRNAGVRESPRSLPVKILKPIQRACIGAGLPDLSAIVIRKIKGDFGHLLQPPADWWDPYVQNGECESGDVPFWFKKFREARDHATWPESIPE